MKVLKGEEKSMDDSGGPNIFEKFGNFLKRKAEKVTEEEILSMVNAGEETGVIENDQSKMINNIFEFDDSTVSDLMTHRTDMSAIEKGDSITALRNLAVEEGYSRIPVYEEDVDNIVGIAYIKDLLKYVGRNIPKTLTISKIMRKALFVPETMPCSVLFAKMCDIHTQMAIVVDEYGGTAGLVTMEDLLESIVGNIQDEYDDEDEEIKKIDENSFTVDGTTDIEDVEKLLGFEFPEGDYDTIGGFIISLLGFIPKDDSVSEADYKNFHFTAFDVEDRRIGTVKIEKKAASEETDEESDDVLNGEEEEKEEKTM